MGKRNIRTNKKRNINKSFNKCKYRSRVKSHKTLRRKTLNRRNTLGGSSLKKIGTGAAKGLSYVIRVPITALYVLLGKIGKTFQMILGTLVMLAVNKLTKRDGIIEMGGFTMKNWPTERIVLLYKCLPAKYKTINIIIGRTSEVDINEDINGVAKNISNKDLLKVWSAIQVYEAKIVFEATSWEMIKKNMSHIKNWRNAKCHKAKHNCDYNYDCHRIDIGGVHKEDVLTHEGTKLYLKKQVECNKKCKEMFNGFIEKYYDDDDDEYYDEAYNDIFNPTMDVSEKYCSRLENISKKLGYPKYELFRNFEDLDVLDKNDNSHITCPSLKNYGYCNYSEQFKTSAARQTKCPYHHRGDLINLAKKKRKQCYIKRLREKCDIQNIEGPGEGSETRQDIQKVRKQPGGFVLGGSTDDKHKDPETHEYFTNFNITVNLKDTGEITVKHMKEISNMVKYSLGRIKEFYSKQGYFNETEEDSRYGNETRKIMNKIHFIIKGTTLPSKTLAECLKSSIDAYYIFVRKEGTQWVRDNFESIEVTEVLTPGGGTPDKYILNYEIDDAQIKETEVGRGPALDLSDAALVKTRIHRKKLEADQHLECLSIKHANEMYKIMTSALVKFVSLIAGAIVTGTISSVWVLCYLLIIFCVYIKSHKIFFKKRGKETKWSELNSEEKKHAKHLNWDENNWLDSNVRSQSKYDGLDIYEKLSVLKLYRQYMPPGTYINEDNIRIIERKDDEWEQSINAPEEVIKAAREWWNSRDDRGVLTNFRDPGDHIFGDFWKHKIITRIILLLAGSIIGPLELNFPVSLDEVISDISEEDVSMTDGEHSDISLDEQIEQNEQNEQSQITDDTLTDHTLTSDEIEQRVDALNAVKDAGVESIRDSTDSTENISVVYTDTLADPFVFYNVPDDIDVGDKIVIVVEEQTDGNSRLGYYVHDVTETDKGWMETTGYNSFNNDNIIWSQSDVPQNNDDVIWNTDGRAVLVDNKTGTSAERAAEEYTQVAEAWGRNDGYYPTWYPFEDGRDPFEDGSRILVQNPPNEGISDLVVPPKGGISDLVVPALQNQVTNTGNTGKTIQGFRVGKDDLETEDLETGDLEIEDLETGTDGLETGTKYLETGTNEFPVGRVLGFDTTNVNPKVTGTKYLETGTEGLETDQLVDEPTSGMMDSVVNENTVVNENHTELSQNFTRMLQEEIDNQQSDTTAQSLQFVDSTLSGRGALPNSGATAQSLQFVERAIRDRDAPPNSGATAQSLGNLQQGIVNPADQYIGKTGIQNQSVAQRIEAVRTPHFAKNTWTSGSDLELDEEYIGGGADEKYELEYSNIINIVLQKLFELRYISTSNIEDLISSDNIKEMILASEDSHPIKLKREYLESSLKKIFSVAKKDPILHFTISEDAANLITGKTDMTGGNIQTLKSYLMLLGCPIEKVGKISSIIKKYFGKIMKLSKKEGKIMKLSKKGGNKRKNKTLKKNKRKLKTLNAKSMRKI